MLRQAVLVLTILLGVSARARGELVVEPATVALEGNFSSAQLIVREQSTSGDMPADTVDRTSEASYASSDPTVAEVNARGRIAARGNGQATITVTLETPTGSRTIEVPVTVTGIVDRPTIDYMRLVNPVIAKAGCNMGACHASQHGKGGLKLSVFAYAPEEDYAAMVRDRDQRRINFLEPDQSLLLLKPTTRVPHGGGRRLQVDSEGYRILRAWIAGGAPAPKADSPHVKRLSLTPTRRLAKEGERQQLRVEAEYSDGSRRDVTAWTRFDSMDEGVVTVDEQGLATVTGKGQAAVMARFEGQAQVALFIVPYREQVDLSDWVNQNFVDEWAVAKFRELGIKPSPLCDDATFVRRAFLDCIGSLPTVEETRAFLDSTDPDKRIKLVDRLLGLTGDPALDVYNDRYAAYWTLKWSDLVRNNSNDLGEQGMWALHNWIREQFRANKPYDQFVRELVTAKGSVYSNGPANYFVVNKDATSLTEATSQLFLGVRLECAKCHHHPFEKYSQDDYYGFAAFFSRVGLKNSEDFGLFGRERVVLVKTSGEVSNPRSRKTMRPTPLEGEPIDHPLDRRIPMAEWLTSKENEYFAKAVVNRYVAYLLGRGLVEPVDDMRSTNPATNPELLDALATDLAAHDFDLKHLIRTIMQSRLYQLDSQPTPDNASDDRFYSHYYVKRIAAEPLLDAVDQVTGSLTKHRNLPLGTRAIELPDAEYPNYFLTTFAKPRRASVCECERPRDPNLAQALHTLNGDILMTKITDPKGTIARLTAEPKDGNPPLDADAILDTLYLAALSRPPSDQERAACHAFLESAASPREGYEDVLWALLNSKEFLFVH